MIQFLLVMFVLAFVCEFIDTSIGGGYGTILTPLSLSMGISPLVIVPAILFSEICTGFTGGFFHHKFNNVDFKIVGIDFIFGFLGIGIGIFTGVRISIFLLKLWIGLIVLVCGILMVFTVKNRYIVKGKFKAKNDIPLTMLCSFNKGMSGGGYGPVSTAGLIAIRAPPKKAVGSTILSEGIVCLIGYIMFISIGKASIQLNPLTIAITIGALLASLPAAYCTNKIDSKKLKLIIAIFIIILGIWTLTKLFI